MDLPPIPSRKRPRASLRYADEVQLGSAGCGRRLACLLAVLGLVQLAQLFDVSISTFQDFLPETLTRQVARHRSLRMRRQLATADDMCPLSHAVQPTRIIQRPVPIASYPGSGAKMTWMLVETLTGLVTADEHRLNGNPWNRAVSIKTHWPHPHGAAAIGHVVDGVDENENDGASFPRAVILLRHPLSAIPSLHNYLYEAQTHTQGHTIRAPLDRWQTWLERSFDAELAAWENHLVYWMDRYSTEERLVVTFEGLTDEVEGPRSSAALVDFLSSGADDKEDIGWTPRTDEEVACIWKKMVQYKKESGSGHEDGTASAKDVPLGNDRILFNPNNPISHRSGSDYRPYTKDQLGRMADMLRRLQGRYGGDGQVAPILAAYLQRVLDSLASPIAVAAFEQ